MDQGTHSKADAALVQVHQSKLTHMDATQREAANATRTAFGADYEARIRSEAGAKPDKTARRKHQISSLYHAAKLKVGTALSLHLPLRIAICVARDHHPKGQ